MKKYYVVYYIKNQPKDSETFKSWEAAVKFKKALLINPNLECIGNIKAIK